ncbi:ornithine cyclodeaminase family protein [Jannaschia sp. 2305UL9-9]|uniref:ornithine cyclodeaminase family protein n=1 Tax=Jannaschia sp. 2305UL9-9 TaxID=3121638 RepID=UPI00352793D5
MTIPYLDAADLIALNLSQTEVVDAIEATIRGAEAGRVWAAPKATIIPGDSRYMMAALAAMDGPSHLAVKMVVLNPENSARGLPQINGLVTMLDSVTGRPLAILDGNWITAVRTAGLSATAARHMARPDAAVAGFVGCGVQAISHLDAFAEMFPLRDVVYFGRGQANKDKFAAHATALGLTATACDTATEVVAGSDLLVTTVTHTGGADPFLDAADMPPGAFAAVVDLAAPWHRNSFGVLDRVAVDDLVQERAMEAKLCDPDHIHGDLSGLVLGTTVGRASEADRTAFVFRGHALGDLALSSLCLTRYLDEK